MERQWLREVVQNILDEPIPEKVKQPLLKLLKPSKGGKTIAPPRRKKDKRRKEGLESLILIRLMGIKQSLTTRKSSSGCMTRLRAWKRGGVS